MKTEFIAFQSRNKVFAKYCVKYFFSKYRKCSSTKHRTPLGKHQPMYNWRKKNVYMNLRIFTGGDSTIPSGRLRVHSIESSLKVDFLLSVRELFIVIEGDWPQSSYLGPDVLPFLAWEKVRAFFLVDECDNCRVVADEFFLFCLRLLLFYLMITVSRFPKVCRLRRSHTCVVLVLSHAWVLKNFI